MLRPVFISFILVNGALPFLLSNALITYFTPSQQQYTLVKAFSLLFLGMFLSTLATLNFSLAFLIGLFSAPLTYIRPLPRRPIVATMLTIPLTMLAPTTVILAGTKYWGLSVTHVLKEAAFGWDVSGMNTQVMVWCVWWPAWLIGMIVLLGKPKVEGEVAKAAGRKNSG